MRWFCLILLTSLLAATQARSEPLTDPLAKDPRLAKKLQLQRQQLRLGELVEELGRETGVRLDVDDKLGPASGLTLTAMFHDRPAWQIMAAICRLYSAPPDRWYWDPAGKDEEARYRLRHSLPLDAAGKAREAFIENWLVEQHQKIMRFAALPPAQRRKLAENDEFLKALNVNPTRSFGKASIVGLLSEQELRSAIRGATIEIPMSRLSPEQVNWWRQEARYYGQVADENTKALTLRREPGEGSLELNLGSGSIVAALGGIWIRPALENYALQGWIDSDERTEAEDRPFPAVGVSAQPADLSLPSVPDTSHARKLARFGKIDVLLDEARGGRHGAVVSLSPRLGDALRGIGQVGLLWKRWDDVYLLRPREWPGRPVSGLVPWPVLKELRAHADAAGDYLAPADWLRMAELSQPQLETLQEEFPDASSILQFLPLFRLAGAMSEAEGRLLSRPGGAGWDDFSMVTRQRMEGLFAPDAHRMRFLLRWEAGAVPSRVSLYSGLNAPRPITIEFKRRVKPDPLAAEKPALRSRD